MDKKPTIEELKLLIDIRDKEKKRKELAISLNICPECGAEIIQENVEIYDKPHIYLFGLIKYKSKWWDYRMICSNDKDHYEYKWKYDLGFPG